MLSSSKATLPLKPLYWIASSLKDLQAMPVPLATPRHEIVLVRRRYQLAQDHYRTLERSE